MNRIYTHMEQEAMPSESESRVPEGHYVQWVNACKEGYGKGYTSSPFDYAGPFTESVLLGNLAMKAYFIKNPAISEDNFWKGADRYIGRKQLLWDPINMKVTNLPEADEWVHRKYRGDWSMG